MTDSDNDKVEEKKVEEKQEEKVEQVVKQEVQNNPPPTTGTPSEYITHLNAAVEKIIDGVREALTPAEPPKTSPEPQKVETEKPTEDKKSHPWFRNWS